MRFICCLLEEHDAEKYRDIIGSMLEEVAKLTAMIDTLLTIAHADSGAIQLRQTTFSLVDLVQEAVAVVGVLAEDKQQTLSVTGDPRALVCADRSFLRMALVNLLDNAVKYSPTGRLGKRRPLRSGAQLHPRYLSRAGIDRTWLPFRTQHG